MPYHRSAVAVALSAAIAAAPVPLAAQEVRNSSYRYQDSIRVLQQSVVVPASVSDVWAALTTSEGLRTWAVPVAHADLRVGGIMESSYDAKAKIGDLIAWCRSKWSPRHPGSATGSCSPGFTRFWS
jgi:hypothetical protein